MATHQHYLSDIFPTFAIKLQNRSERQTIGNDNDNENYIKYPQLTQIDTFKMEYVWKPKDYQKESYSGPPEA